MEEFHEWLQVGDVRPLKILVLSDQSLVRVECRLPVKHQLWRILREKLFRRDLGRFAIYVLRRRFLILVHHIHRSVGATQFLVSEAYEAGGILLLEIILFALFENKEVLVVLEEAFGEGGAAQLRRLRSLLHLLSRHHHIRILAFYLQILQFLSKRNWFF